MPYIVPSALLVVALILASATDNTVRAAPPEIQLAQAEQDDAARQAAAERAAAMTGGKVLSAEPDEVDGKPVYRVKVLTPDGHVKTVVVEADTR